MEDIRRSVWEGGGGGDGVQVLPTPPDLAPVSGEQGGVGSLGFLVLGLGRGKVFFSAGN